MEAQAHAVAHGIGGAGVPVIVGAPEGGGVRPLGVHVVGGVARLDALVGVGQQLQALGVAVLLLLSWLAHAEGAVEAGGVAVELVAGDIQEEQVTGEDLAVGTGGGQRVCHGAGGDHRVLDVLTAVLVQGLGHDAGQLILHHAGPGLIYHGGEGVGNVLTGHADEDELLVGLAHPGVIHNVLGADALDAALTERLDEQALEGGTVDTQGSVGQAVLGQPVADSVDIVVEDGVIGVGGGQTGCAQTADDAVQPGHLVSELLDLVGAADHPGAAVLGQEAAGGLDLAAGSGDKVVADVALGIAVEGHHGVDAEFLHGLLGALQALPAQLLKVQPLLKTDREFAIVGLVGTLDCHK